MDYQGRITIDPEIRFGKPCVRGTRITVGDVLSYLASGMREDEILSDFPHLTREDIRACLAFAAERERRVVSIPLPKQAARLLFDENLAARLVGALADLYPGSVHVSDVGLAPAADRQSEAPRPLQGQAHVRRDQEVLRVPEPLTSLMT